MSLSEDRPVIAIDGTAGSGKSTVAKATADHFGFAYIDTGAMYRALTLKAIKKCVDFGDGPALQALAKEMVIEVEEDGGADAEHVFLDGVDVTADIRLPDVTLHVSQVSSHPEVRHSLVAHQRAIVAAAKKGAVAEGRDVGTVVFPDALLKVFLDASLAERAKRRQKDLKRAGVAMEVSEIEKLIAERDRKDSSRETSPLRRADDAILLDTTDLNAEEVEKKVIALVEDRLICSSG